MRMMGSEPLDSMESLSTIVGGEFSFVAVTSMKPVELWQLDSATPLLHIRL